MAERSQSTLDQLGAAAQLPAVPIVIVRTDWNAAIVDRLEGPGRVIQSPDAVVFISKEVNVDRLRTPGGPQGQRMKP